MNKNYLKAIVSLLITILFAAGCEKQINDEPATFTQSENVLQSKKSHGDDKDGCRLISNSSEYGQETFTYNKKGLLDKWYISYYDGYFKLEYDEKGRLVKSQLYSGGAIVNTIHFSYRDNRIVKETWYTGTTKEKMDEVFYYYNTKGQIKKNVSIMQDYTNSYEYTQEGNLLKWVLSFGGTPSYSSEYTYLHRHKNPFSAIPGVGNAFPYANGVFNLNKWYSTSEKDVFYDEEGNAVVEVDQDPYKTIVQWNRSNYVTASDFFDVLTQEYVHFRFEYENCGHDDRDKGESAQRLSPAGNHKNILCKLLKKGSTKSIKEQVRELRELKNIKNSSLQN